MTPSITVAMYYIIKKKKHDILECIEMKRQGSSHIIFPLSFLAFHDTKASNFYFSDLIYNYWYDDQEDGNVE